MTKVILVSHAVRIRPWLVPCTQIDISELTCFLKDYNDDEHCGSSKTGDSAAPSYPVHITHGHRVSLRIMPGKTLAEDCMYLDFIGTARRARLRFPALRIIPGPAATTAKNYVALLSDYLESYLYIGFDAFLPDTFEGSPFTTRLLETAHRFWRRTKQPHFTSFEEYSVVQAQIPRYA